MLAFGNLGVSGNGMTVQGWLYDVKNITSPQVLGKQYQDAATSRRGATDRPQVCRRNHLSAGRRHCRHCGKQDLLRQQPQRT